jgi:hypothetical protein
MHFYRKQRIIKFMLIIHILIACTGLVLSSYNFIKPLQKLFIVNNLLLAATIASGAYLTVIGQSHLMAACATGLVYTIVVLGLQYGARTRLAQQNVNL